MQTDLTADSQAFTCFLKIKPDYLDVGLSDFVFLFNAFKFFHHLVTSNLPNLKNERANQTCHPHTGCRLTWCDFRVLFHLYTFSVHILLVSYLCFLNCKACPLRVTLCSYNLFTWKGACKFHNGYLFLGLCLEWMLAMYTSICSPVVEAMGEKCYCILSLQMRLAWLSSYTKGRPFFSYSDVVSFGAVSANQSSRI